MSVLINEAYANDSSSLWAKPSDALYTAGSGISIASNVVANTQNTIVRQAINGINNQFAKTIVTGASSSSILLNGTAFPTNNTAYMVSITGYMNFNVSTSTLPFALAVVYALGTTSPNSTGANVPLGGFNLITPNGTGATSGTIQLPFSSTFIVNRADGGTFPGLYYFATANGTGQPASVMYWTAQVVALAPSTSVTTLTNTTMFTT